MIVEDQESDTEVQVNLWDQRFLGPQKDNYSNGLFGSWLSSIEALNINVTVGLAKRSFLRAPEVKIRLKAALRQDFEGYKVIAL